MGDKLADRKLFNTGPGAATAVLMIASDRGLCGSYNTQIFAALESWLRAEDRGDVRFFVYGRKGYQYLTKRGLKVERYLVEPPLEKVDYRAAKFAAHTARELFLSGEYRSVIALYTAFESMAKYVPTFVQLLPVEKEQEPGEKLRYGVEPILEPDIETLLERLVPRYLETRIYNALLESVTSEYASRRMSMKNATDAATDMQSVLKGIYNRKRQETITKDLLDIVGGAEALR
jgi:F-type H+-transporting ATPase subunit gamma